MNFLKDYSHRKWYQAVDLKDKLIPGYVDPVFAMAEIDFPKGIALYVRQKVRFYTKHGESRDFDYVYAGIIDYISEDDLYAITFKDQTWMDETREEAIASLWRDRYQYLDNWGSIYSLFFRKRSPVEIPIIKKNEHYGFGCRCVLRWRSEIDARIQKF